MNQTSIHYKCHYDLRPQVDFVGPETDLVLMTIGRMMLVFRRLSSNVSL